MASLVADRFYAGLRWEPLLGLEREAKEIRTLLARRAITRYAIYAGEMGARSLGLVPANSEAAPSEAPCALLCLIGAALKQRSFLFVHPHPDDAGKVLLIGVRDDRPELDEVLDAGRVPAATGQFLGASSLSEIVVAGVAPPTLPDLEIGQPLAIADVLAAAAQRDLASCAIKSQKPRVSLRVKPLMGVVAGLTMLGGAAAFWLNAEDEPAEMPAYNLAESFQSRLNQTLLSEINEGGAYLAQALHTAITSIPVDVHGWRVVAIECTGKSCIATRRRQIGADGTAMLAALPTVKLESLDRAIETIPVTLPHPAAPDVTPIDEAAFYSRTAARLQQLGDYGLSPTLQVADPILPVPSALSSAASLKIVKRGTWALSGDLAFLDSLTALVVNSQNMVLKTLHIDLSVAAPVFKAKGYYYVN